jgi:hypothetical protein
MSIDDELCELQTVRKGDPQDMEEDLAAMASDPDIQAEIAAIDEEFAVAEMDGLEKL